MIQEFINKQAVAVTGHGFFWQLFGGKDVYINIS